MLALNKSQLVTVDQICGLIIMWWSRVEIEEMKCNVINSGRYDNTIKEHNDGTVYQEPISNEKRNTKQCCYDQCQCPKCNRPRPITYHLSVK